MKKVSLLLALLMMLALLASCSGGAASSSSAQGSGSTAATTADKKTLQVVWFSDGGEGDSFRRLADKYEQENPNIKIEMIEVPYAEMDNKIKNMLAAKQPPALARLSNIGMYSNQLVDLTEYAQSGADFEKNFAQSMKFKIDGKMVAAPLDTTVNGLIYNKTAFDKAGITVPQTPEDVWTWEEWKEALQKVMADGGVKYGLVYDKSPSRFTTLLYQAGGGMLNEDLTKADINTPEALRAVNFFKDLHSEGIIPESVWLGSENPNNMFRTGQVGMHLGGSWLIANYRNEITDFEWGVTYLPKDAQRSSIPGGKYLAAFQGSGVEKEAALFIEWLSKPENNAQYCTENYFLSPVIGNESLEYDFGQEYFEIFANELQATGTRPGREWGYQEFTAKVQEQIRDNLAEVVAGNMTPEEYLQGLDEKFNEVLGTLQS